MTIYGVLFFIALSECLWVGSAAIILTHSAGRSRNIFEEIVISIGLGPWVKVHKIVERFKNRRK